MPQYSSDLPSANAHQRPRGAYLNFPWAVPSRPIYTATKRKISVVLPIFNHAGFLRSAVESIFAQNSSDIELVIVDDGSTDNFDSVVSAFQGDTRIRVFKQENRGLSHALNRGFQETRGDYVTWTSADNRFRPGALDRMGQFLTLNPSIAFVYANVELISADDSPLSASGYRVENQRPGERSILDLPASADTLLHFNDNFINACFLFRKALRSAVGGFDQSKNGYEDYDFWVRSQLFGNFAHIDTAEPFYEYRLHADSLTGRLSSAALHQAQQRSLLGTAHRTNVADKLQFELSCSNSHTEELLTLTDLIGTGSRRSSPEMAKPIFAVAKVPKFETVTTFESIIDRIDFLHQGSARYLKGRPFRARRPSNLGVNGELLVLPPIDFPPLLRRARDGNLGAVVRGPETKLAVLFFSPEQSERSKPLQAQFKELIGGSTELLWVAFCRSHSGRAFADELNLSLSSNSNFRIIDASTEPSHAWQSPQAEHFTAEPWQERSLLYALSGVDAIVSLKPDLSRFGMVLELRCEAALAAAAGIPLVALTTPAPQKQSQNISDALSQVTDCSHLAIESNELAAAALFEVLSKMTAEFDLNSAEQWLGMQEPPDTARRVRAVMLGV